MEYSCLWFIRFTNITWPEKANILLYHRNLLSYHQKLLENQSCCRLRGEAFTCLRQFLTYHAATITLLTILGLSLNVLTFETDSVLRIRLLYQKRILVNKSVPFEIAHKALGRICLKTKDWFYLSILDTSKTSIVREIVPRR